MPPTPVYFSNFPVSSQVFYRSSLSFAIVNLKPLLPGHILVCPKRVVPRLHDLRADEVADLFLAVQKLGTALEKIFDADGLNIALQDGPLAGQSVPHVHVHIIPRHKEDLPEDEIYRLLESDDADIARAHGQTGGADTPSTGLLAKGIELSRSEEAEGVLKERGKFPVVSPDEERPPRTEKEMMEEAAWLAKKVGEFEAGGHLHVGSQL